MPARYLQHDWFSQPLPSNVSLHESTWLYSTYAFVHYGSKQPLGLRVGSDTGLYHGTFFDIGPEAEVEIGKYCSLVGVIFATNGHVTVEDYTFIAHEVVIADQPWASPVGGAIEDRTVEHNRITRVRQHIGRNVWIGARAAIIGSVRIGEGAIIGAGAVVTDDVPPYTLCVGNPMK